MTDKILEQIFAIRDTGLVNMLDCRSVQRLAFERNFCELVCFIEEHKVEYWNFIIHGKEGKNENFCG